ncbi:MAG: RsbRD N-terminal domain-containing protein [Blastocatellia bacterium]
MAHADLADWIETRKEEITDGWALAVRQEPRIQSDTGLSETGLRDHIPSVISEISDLIRLNEFPTLTNTREARVHTYVRFRQGYRGREIVRELSLLRLTLLDQVAERLKGGAQELTLETYLSAARLINLYIDEELSYAVSVYAEAMKPAE